MRSLKLGFTAFLGLITLLVISPFAFGQQALKQSSTSRKIVFLMIDSSDHVTGKPTLTPTVTISKNGAAFASPAGSVAELSGGWYVLTPTSADTGTLGPLLLHATSAGADPTDKEFNVVAYDPDDAVHLGLSALPNAAAGANNGLPLGDASGRVLLQPVTHTGARIPNVTLADTITTYTGNTVQSGDAFGRIGAAGAGLTALGDTRLAHLDADVSTRMATFGLPTNFSSLLINGSGQVQHDLTQALNTASTGDTVGGALVGARAQAFGKWVISGSTLTMYAADGTTVVKTFTISPAPTAASRQ